MTSQARKRLVIDASVARAAGETEHGVSRSCREFLEAVLKICHQVVFCSEGLDEWKRHESGPARRWYRSMTARRKVVRIHGLPDLVLDDNFLAPETEERDRAAMEKDLFLLKAALATDGIVVSRDEKIRTLFNHASRSNRKIGNIVWINPAHPSEDPLEWLEAGAPAERERTLGAR